MIWDTGVREQCTGNATSPTLTTWETIIMHREKIQKETWAVEANIPVP